MDVMSWSNIVKITLVFVFLYGALIGAVLVFQQYGLDTNFLVTFILALLSIFISVSFYISSSYLNMELRELLKEINVRVQNIEQQYTGGSSLKFITKKAIPPKR